MAVCLLAVGAGMGYMYRSSQTFDLPLRTVGSEIFVTLPNHLMLAEEGAENDLAQTALKVFVFVPSAKGSAKMRVLQRIAHDRILRMAKLAYPNIEYTFRYILGETSPDETDVIYISKNGELDSDRNARDFCFTSSTTSKVLFGIRTAAAGQYDFVLRAAEDTYTNFVNLSRQLVRMPREKVLWGRFTYRQRMHQEHTSQGGMFPPFPLGIGYVMSKDVVDWLATASKNDFLQVSCPEDGAIGLWLAGTTVVRYDDMRFHHIPLDDGTAEPWATRGCFPTDIVSHYMNAAAWGRIDEQGNLDC